MQTAHLKPIDKIKDYKPKHGSEFWNPVGKPNQSPGISTENFKETKSKSKSIHKIDKRKEYSADEILNIVQYVSNLDLDEECQRTGKFF